MTNEATRLTHTGAQIDAAVDAVANKQDKISDLDTIRSNASSAYKKPSTGIPKNDLASAVQTSLGKADSALQSESDPVFSASAAYGITSSDITNWNGKTSNTGTVTSVTINATSPISINNSNAITTSGSRTISHANSGVTAGTYRSVTVNATGHVTAGTNPTTLSGYGITDAKIANGVITLGSNTITPLTSHQDISGKADKSSTVSMVTYNTTSKKITKTINGTTSDVVTAAKIVTDGGGITEHQSVVLATGTNDGTMKITVGGAATDNVAVKGFSDLVARVLNLEQNSVFYKGHYLTSNSPFAKNSAVYFNGRMFVSNAQTSDTPMPVYANSAGNRLVLSDGGYIIASETINSTWDEKYE